eukprot:CAMPEP_0204320762 /NCGR_PEP_ID=MMETSP0469-20131031/7805_1 /ASSEMBLY_ACC=CAM_ASM_000384 /TAXON_ID=2969 /ORGANISM="Oxyrrhis marina" /LENGTH=146 /DNA_ID=CAMNT_0051302027 /DNA_START=27 /DNA_END=468 /DNA_ORIENTATION=+
MTTWRFGSGCDPVSDDRNWRWFAEHFEPSQRFKPVVRPMSASSTAASTLSRPSERSPMPQQWSRPRPRSAGGLYRAQSDFRGDTRRPVDSASVSTSSLVSPSQHLAIKVGELEAELDVSGASAESWQPGSPGVRAAAAGDPGAAAA